MEKLVTLGGMDTQEIKQKLQREGLQERESQLTMIEAVHQTIKSQQILCIEAPTGTGKTISYCLGSYLAKQSQQKLIISTATIALQEQLYNSDLPLLEKILNKKIKYAIAKGRRRYVCHARLYSRDTQGDLWEENTTIPKLQQQLEQHRWNGDRDRLRKKVDERTWQSISTDSAGCAGKNCDFYDECVFYKARKKMHSAEIIITNHSLLLSDFELGAGAILPEPENNIYIIDECHQLPDKALDHFARFAAISGSIDWLNNLTKAVGKATVILEISTDKQQEINACIHTLIQELKLTHEFLGSNLPQFRENIWRVDKPTPELITIAQQFKSLSLELMGHCQWIIEKLESLIKQNEQNSEEEEKTASNKLLTNMKFLHDRAENLYQTWQLFCYEPQADEAPIARWFSHKNEQFTCHCAPINISKQLRQHFWSQTNNGAVLCSATIRSLGKFDDYRRKIGLRDHPSFIEKSIASFFDYTKSVLFVPRMQSEPIGAQQEQHRREVIELLPQLILPKAGTLVLFTSKSAMEDTFAAMPLDLIDDILMQGDLGKGKIIAQHKSRIQSGHRSVLFGLASFGEGLDLPADLCQHVIINKLPFAVPTTPLELTRNDWLQQNNKNAFMLASLPAASLRLTQYVGRLIRHENDSGIVTILDKRLYSKNYGKLLLDNLPNFTQMINKTIHDLKCLDSVSMFYPALV